MRFTAEFDPQAWVNDYAVSVDPEGETEWDCTEFIAPWVSDDGTLRPPFRERSYGDEYLDNDDILKDDPAAPQWVLDWTGPFTITVTQTEE